jgi:hypothetical protein
MYWTSGEVRYSKKGDTLVFSSGLPDIANRAATADERLPVPAPSTASQYGRYVAENGNSTVFWKTAEGARRAEPHGYLAFVERCLVVAPACAVITEQTIVEPAFDSL